jgi:hypothetical protein
MGIRVAALGVGLPEQVYWNYEYLMAIQDVPALIANAVPQQYEQLSLSSGLNAALAPC